MSEKKKTKIPAKKKLAKAKAPAKKVTSKSAKKTKLKSTPKASPKAPQKTQVYEHLFDNPLNVKRTIYGLFAVSGILFILDFFVERHVDHPWEGVVGFYAIYGFVACVLLVLVAKELRKVLMRGEDYYDE